MRKQFLIPVLVGILALGAANAFAQSATVVLRNGDRVQGNVIDMGRNFTINVNGQMRSLPLGDVVLIDFAGDGRNIPAEELNKANASNGYVVMRNGEQLNTRLQDFTGKPLVAIFADGRRSNIGDISRIYFGSVNNVPGFPNNAAVATSSAPSAAPGGARSVVVPGNVQWTNTGIAVRRGQRLRFEPTGEVRLSFNGDDMAKPAGSATFRHSDKAPIPSIPVGALMGRVGNGQPFSIGDTTQVFDMPENGRLFLGVNDDHVADNSGNYVVKVWEQ